MHIQLNTGTSVQGSDSMAAWARGELTERLSRFRDHITRVEVHLSDINGAKAGDGDKRCVLEVRLAGRQPLAVTHVANRVADALTGACEKLHNAMDTALGKERLASRRETIRGV